MITFAKWELIIDYCEGHSNVYLNCGHAKTCGLCMMFVVTCEGCPVGSWECSGTPYNDYISALTNYGALQAAKEELRFLRGLYVEAGI